MKARQTLIILAVAVVLLIPAMCVHTSDDSDAMDGTYTENYSKQLTPNQKIIYDALKALDASTVHKEAVYGSSTQDWVVKVTVPSTYVLSSSSSATLKELVYADMVAAWQASYLDNPMAWWAWTTDCANIALYGQSFTLSVASVTGFTFYIYIDETYAANGSTMAEKVTAVNNAVDKIVEDKKISGNSQVDIVKSINSYLCSSEFKYDKTAAYCNSVYGAFVAKSDDVHKILCTGYSQAFRMLCDKYGIDCLTVVGLAAQSSENGGHMWNLVKVNATIDGTNGSYVLAVDSTYNATCGDNMRYLLVGALTEYNGVTFTMGHQAFASVPGASDMWVDFHFKCPELNSKAYSFPAQADILASVLEFMPWILVGVVCLILAYVLWTVGKRGD